MSKKNFVKLCVIGISLLTLVTGLLGIPPKKSNQSTMYLNFQKLVVYHSKSNNKYYIAAHSTDQSTSPGNFDTMNVHAILEMKDGNKKTIDNEDLMIACLGNMYNKVIGEKNTLFRFNMIIDNSGSIDRQSLSFVQQSLTKFIQLVPLVFEAQVIRFSDNTQLKTKFTKDKETLIDAVNQSFPQGGTALYDTIEEGVQELKALGDEVPLRFSVVLTDGKDTASKRNTDANTFKNKIINECRRNHIPLFIVGVTDAVDSALLKEIVGFGHYEHIKNFPDIDKAFTLILNLIKDTYIFQIPAVGNFSDLKTIWLVKKTPSGNNVETIQDFIVH